MYLLFWSFFLHPSNTQTTEDDKVIVLKYIWKLSYFLRTRPASLFISSRSFPKDCFVIIDLSKALLFMT